MANIYPIQVDAREGRASGQKAGAGQYRTLSDMPIIESTAFLAEGLESREISIFTIANWPESKVEMELSCWDIPIIGRVCTNLPRLYMRNCTKRLYVTFTYPVGTWADVEACLVDSAVTATIAGVVIDPEVGIAVFIGALQACLRTKGKEWANQVTAVAGINSLCEDWHPV
jgi:hypothetical protein